MSARSADALSTMSQPVRNASAPRLAPPRRNRRRVGPGMSFAASLTRRRASTPGGFFRMRDMLGSGTLSWLSADDHGAQRFRDEKAHDDVNDEKGDDCSHGEEVHVACRRITAEQSGEFLQLHRLPDGETRQHDHDAD